MRCSFKVKRNMISGRAKGSVIRHIVQSHAFTSPKIPRNTLYAVDIAGGLSLLGWVRLVVAVFDAQPDSSAHSDFEVSTGRGGNTSTS